MFDSDRPNNPPIFYYLSPWENITKGIISFSHGGTYNPYATDQNKIDNSKIWEWLDQDLFRKKNYAFLLYNITSSFIDLDKNVKDNSAGLPDDKRDFLITQYYLPYYDLLKGLLGRPRKILHEQSLFLNIRAVENISNDIEINLQNNQEDFTASFQKYGFSCSQKIPKIPGEILDFISKHHSQSFNILLNKKLLNSTKRKSDFGKAIMEFMESFNP